MSLSRRAFVRRLGMGGAGMLSASFVVARGHEELVALGRGAGLESLLQTATALEPIKISSNENARGPSPKALQAMADHVTSNLGRGYPVPGEREFVETIAGLYGAQPENVLVSTGSGAELHAGVLAHVTPSRPLVTGQPSYGSPERTASEAGGTVKHVPVDASLFLDLDGMVQAANGAGLVFLCNPNNPTSTAHTLADVEQAVRAIKQQSPDTAVLVDEAYLDYATAPGVASAVQLALELPGVFITRTFSKAYGMAGMRIGYAVGQPETLEKLSTAWGLGDVNTLSAVAGTAALKDTAHMDWERQENGRIRDFILTEFRQMGYEAPDSQTNFVFVNLRRPAAGFRDACRERGVLVGRDFPPMEQTHCRISLGTMEEMQKAMAVFKEVLGTSTSM